jgi:lipoprotein-anchoring transpeptidase ErfK/SrfK
MRLLVFALVLLFTLLPPLSASADEMIVDNADASVQISGTWTTITQGDGFVGPNYLTLPGGSSGANIMWPVPSGLAPGHYQVFARWTGGSGHSSAAVYHVQYDGGAIDLRRDQRSNGGDWQPLGDFDFRPDPSEGVSLSNGQPDGVLVADAIRWVSAPPPATPTPRPAASPQPAQAAQAPDASWTVTLQVSDLHAGPDNTTAVLASVPQFSYLQVLGYQGDWAYVYNPRARGTAYVPSGMLGPSEAPPAWVTASPPTATATLETMARSVGETPIAYYPVDDKFAYTAHLGHNVPILVHDRVDGVGGSTWYRIDQGYVPAASVRFPSAPATTYPGRWLDADLREPAMLTAYQGGVPIMSTLAIKGTIANQTPTGVFSIGRRVADETMDSTTIGIPYPGPGGYHLEHVLYTQYFTSDGASIHYNYWSSNWGFAGSHGCLGLPLAESQFLWNWADLGTIVVVHT